MAETATEEKGLPAPGSEGLSPLPSPDGGKVEAQVAEPAKGTEGEPPPETPWASITEEAQLWELEPVKTKFAEREEEAKRTGKEEFRKESLPYLQRQEARIETANKQIADLLDTTEKLTETIQATGLDEREYKRLLRDAEPLRKALTGL